MGMKVACSVDACELWNMKPVACHGLKKHELSEETESSKTVNWRNDMWTEGMFKIMIMIIAHALCEQRTCLVAGHVCHMHDMCDHVWAYIRGSACVLHQSLLRLC